MHVHKASGLQGCRVAGLRRARRRSVLGMCHLLHPLSPPRRRRRLGRQLVRQAAHPRHRTSKASAASSTSRVWHRGGWVWHRIAPVQPDETAVRDELRRVGQAVAARAAAAWVWNEPESASLAKGGETCLRLTLARLVSASSRRKSRRGRCLCPSLTLGSGRHGRSSRAWSATQSHPEPAPRGRRAERWRSQEGRYIPRGRPASLQETSRSLEVRSSR